MEVQFSLHRILLHRRQTVHWWARPILFHPLSVWFCSGWSLSSSLPVQDLPILQGPILQWNFPPLISWDFHNLSHLCTPIVCIAVTLQNIHSCTFSSVLQVGSSFFMTAVIAGAENHAWHIVGAHQILAMSIIITHLCIFQTSSFLNIGKSINFELINALRMNRLSWWEKRVDRGLTYSS